MSWLDFIALGGFATLVSIAYAQGAILEVTQVIALVVGGALSFRMYGRFAEYLHENLFTGWSIGFLNKLCLFGLYGVIFITIFSLGLTLERRAKEEHIIEKTTDRQIGLVLGLFKSVWLVCLLLGLFFYNDMAPKRQAKEMRQGAIVSMFFSARPIVTPTVYIMAPTDLAKDFVRVGLQGKKPRKKKSKSKKKKKK